MLLCSQFVKHIVLLGAVFCLYSAPASSTVLLYNFNNPPGVLGTSSVYTSNGVSVTAFGYKGSSAVNLYEKNQSGDEVGIGIAGGDNEIQTNEFIQLDLSQFWATNPTNVAMSIGSVQVGESWKIYGSNTLGVLGTLEQSGTTDYPNTFNLTTALNSFRYLSVQSSSGDTLISTLSGHDSVLVPEPLTWVVLGTGLSIGLLCKKRKECRA